jgi:antitoxin (DNA-binding transcriptional repressor) of toxin-antitoxin stability system
MKTVSVRELRSEMPRLRELLEKEHELLLVSNGEPVARILPAPRRRQVPSLAEHRARMPLLDTPSEALIREERDRR